MIILDIILGKEIGGGFEIAKYLLSFKTAIPVIFYAENIKSINLESKIEYSINLPENTMLNGDGFMLEQILDKLISNAKDFDDKTAPIKIIAN